MKKIAAFFTALGLFIIIIAIFHFSLTGNLKTNNKDFGTWVSPYKDLSYNAISQNMHKDTMLVFGSSEFRHGIKTKYHPKSVFENQNVSLMLIGGPYNQCLNHAITLGAVENKIQKKKVVLLVSPSWFYKSGVTPDRYSLRFSESNYMALMENKKIPKSIKRYVAARSEKLLSTNDSMQQRVKRDDRIFVYGQGNAVDNLIYSARKAYVTDKDYITVNGILKTSKIRKLSEYHDRITNPEAIGWSGLSSEAIDSARRRSHNEFFMSDKVWNGKLKSKYPISKDIHIKETYKTSPEYGDLECFLKICKAENIKPMLVVLPQNGYWFDYTGISAAKREYFASRIKKIGKEYNAEVSDFTKYDYTPYFVRDAVHPWGRGWVKIDEKIYEFYNQI